MVDNAGMESAPSNGIEETSVAALSSVIRDLESTSGRLDKRRRIAQLLRSLNREEISPAVLMLVAGIFPEAEAKALNIGHATVHSALEIASHSSSPSAPLTILSVNPRFEEIAKVRRREAGEQRRKLLVDLFARTSPDERQALVGIIFGELRIGVSEGMMLTAIADAAEVPPAQARAPQTFLGNLGKVAEIRLVGAGNATQSIA